MTDTPTTEAIKGQAPTIACVDDINRELSHRAYAGTSFSPERRGDTDRQDYANAVNGLYAELWTLAKTDEQKTLLAEEMERYRQGYIKHLTAYLHSHSAVVSAMIVGPANFPVHRMQKRGQWADNKVRELLDWDKRARAAIRGKLLDARPQEEKDAAEWAAVRRDILGSLGAIKEIDENGSPYTRSAFVNSIAGKIERLAQAGEVNLVSKSLALLREYDASHKKPALSARHKAWTFDKLADQAKARNDARAGKPQELLAEAEGVELWADYRLDRVQLCFKDKPSHELREKLKRSGWKWAPSQEAWQRQLTETGIACGKAILAGLTPPAQEQSEGRAV